MKYYIQKVLMLHYYYCSAIIEDNVGLFHFVYDTS